MAEVITRKVALEVAIAAVENEEVRKVLEKMHAQICKPRKKAGTKPETLEFRAAVATFLAEADGPQKNADIVVGMNDGVEKGEEGYISFQKVAAALRALEADGTVVRIKAEKPSGKDTFALVN